MDTKTPLIDLYATPLYGYCAAAKRLLGRMRRSELDALLAPAPEPAITTGD